VGEKKESGRVEKEMEKEKEIYITYIAKDVMVIFREAFHPSIHSSRHPSVDGIIQGRKP
jgi:hypothetical protein